VSSAAENDVTIKSAGSARKSIKRERVPTMSMTSRRRKCGGWRKARGLA
jgi:hypothetical protein